MPLPKIFAISNITNAPSIATHFALRSFKHATLATALGVPKFQLSRNEILLQTTFSSESFEGTITKGKAAASPVAADDRKKSMAMVQDAAKFARMLQANMDKTAGAKPTIQEGSNESTSNESSRDTTPLSTPGGTKRSVQMPPQDENVEEVDKVAPLGMTRPKRGSVERRKTTFVRASISLDEEEDDDEFDESESPEFMQRLRSQSTEDYALNCLSFALDPPTDPYAYLNDVDTAALDTRHVSHKALTPSASTISIIGRVHLEIATLYGTGR